MLSTSVVVSHAYLAVPILAVGVAVVRARWLRNAEAVREFVVTSVAGAVGGLALMIAYLQGFNVDVSGTQVAIACYWGIAVANVLRGFSAALAWVFWWLTPKRVDGRPCCTGVTIASAILRSAILIGVIVPYIGAMVLMYRPRVVHQETPMSVLGADYEEIAFSATDGTRLRGWWIPAGRVPLSDDSEESSQLWGKRTVIFCHGFGADKASQLSMVRDLVPHGFNVLAFDFRASGESDGQLTTFGDLERRDVLGAVRWAQTHHPKESAEIFGLGESSGAAALIAAAGDPGPQGQAIRAIAVFSPYDRLDRLVQQAADDHHVHNAGWIATHWALPLAGLQMGTSLAQFSPANEVDKFAPRPLLVIACERDGKIPPTLKRESVVIDVDLARSEALYNQASQPKYAYWIKQGGRSAMLFENQDAATAVRVFFEMARQMI